MTKKDAVDSVIPMFFRPLDRFHGTMTRKIPKNFLQKFLTGLQQDKKLAPLLAGVFSMTGHSYPN